MKASPARLTPTHLVLVVVTALMWLAGTVTVILADPVRYNDSPGYVPGTGGDAAGTVSLLGDAVRAWPTVVLYGLAGSDPSRVALQTAIALAAWSLLIWAFLARVRPLVAAVAGGLLAVLALAPVAYQWNLLILSDSLSISLVLGGVALLRLGVPPGPRATLWTWLGLLALSLAGVSKLPATAILLAALVWCIARWARSGRLHDTISRPREATRANWGAIAAGGAAAVLLVVYPVAVNSAIDRAWVEGEPGGTSRNAVNFYFLTATDINSGLSPIPEASRAGAQGLLDRAQAASDALVAALPDDAPECLGRAPFSGEPGPFDFREVQVRDCPDGVAWVQDRFVIWYATFLVTHPDYVADVLAYRLPVSLTAAPYTGYVSLVPPALALLFADATLGEVTYLPLPLWLLAGLIAWAIVAVRFVRGRRIAGGSLLLAAFPGGIAAWSVTLLVMNAEMQRISAVATVPLLAFSILLLAGLAQATGEGEANRAR